ncbi:hypothetical protein C8J57DRAFT_1088132, partial [Mycena rebaudengoi]
FISLLVGNAGNVVANRLTENPDFSVLVLEAGPSYEIDPTLHKQFLIYLGLGSVGRSVAVHATRLSPECTATDLPTEPSPRYIGSVNAQKARTSVSRFVG